MNEEAAPNEAENEGSPGSLGDAFEGFAPGLPAGSWERLTERRIKRRRFVAWWWLPVLLVAGGLSAWYFGRTLDNKMAVPTKEIAVIPRADPPENRPSNTKEILPEESGALLKKSTQTSENESEKGRETDVEEPTESAPGSILATDKWITGKPTVKPSENQKNSEEVDVAHTLKTKQKTPQAREKSGISVSNSLLFIPKKKGRVPGFFKKEKHLPARTESEIKHISERTTSGKKEAPMPVQKNAIETNQNQAVTNKQQTGVNSDANENTTVEGNSSPPIGISTANGAVSDSSHAKPVAPPDSIPQKSAVTPLPETRTDSSKEKQARKFRIGFEAGLSGIVVHQQVTLRRPGPQSSDVTFREPTHIKPMLGGNIQVRMAIPVYRRWTFLPMADVAFLSQTTTYEEKAGPSSDVKLVKTSNGIEGSPAFISRSFSEERWLALATVGAEIGFEATQKLQLRVGVGKSYPYLVVEKNDFTPPQVKGAAFLAALQYRVGQQWFIRSEVRHFSIFNFAIPGGISNESKNVQLGLGVVWKMR